MPMPTTIEILSPIVAAVLTGALSWLGSYWLFRSKFRTEAKAALVREQLGTLLLPLFVVLKNEEFGWHALLQTNLDYSPEEWIADSPKRLRKIRNILERRLYLASETLHYRSLEFLQWLEVNADTDERYQRVMNSMVTDGSFPDSELRQFTKAVAEEYQTKRREYMRLGGHGKGQGTERKALDRV